MLALALLASVSLASALLADSCAACIFSSRLIVEPAAFSVYCVLDVSGNGTMSGHVEPLGLEYSIDGMIDGIAVRVDFAVSAAPSCASITLIVDGASGAGVDL